MKPLVNIPLSHPKIAHGLSGPVWLSEDGIIFIVLGNEAEHTLVHAKSQIEALEKVCKGIPRPVLADVTNLKAISREAREYYTGGKNMQKITALGIVSASKVGRFVANFFIGVNLHTEIPIRICDDLETAIQWLKRFTNDK